MFDWLLEFARVMINIGYSSGVKVVYFTFLKDKDPNVAKGDVDA